MAKVIASQALRDWLNGLASSETLVAPVMAGDRSFFRQIAAADEIAFDYGQSTVSPKEWFLPKSDPLFAFDPTDSEIDLPLSPGPRVIFGIRPCDANALSILDRPFLMDPADELYRARRQDTALVGLACDKSQQSECFCTSIGGSPQDSTHLDILMADNGDGYVAEAITDRGRQLLESAVAREEGAMPPAPIIEDGVPVEGSGERILAHFNGRLWERLADRCLGCRMCSFVCPTCHCFDVRDYTVEGRVQRIRSWDSCQSKLFTKLAGGHNTRGTKAARLRQFYAHKFAYYPDRFSDHASGAVCEPACVGCGRCAHYCPVNIDIRETLRDLRELEVQR